MTLIIEKMVYGGHGMGRFNGKVVFVPCTAPGDRVRVEIVQDKKNYAEAAIKAIERGSPLRIDPFCSLFGKCGGCHYQHISYAQQLKLKEEILKESMAHLKLKEEFEVLPILFSPRDQGYRIRARLKGGEGCRRKTLGFYAPKTHSLVEVEQCPLLHPQADKILQGLHTWLADEPGNFPLQGADIQVSPDEKKGVIRLHIKGNRAPTLAEQLGQEIPGVKGIVVEGDKDISWGDLSLSYRSPNIFGREPLKIRANDSSFSQVNPFQNVNLMKQVVEWAGLSGKEKVLDLFCGSGNLTLPLAQQAQQVWGVDQDRQAIKTAEANARENGLGNCIFIPAGAKEGIQEVGRKARSVDVAVLDPPRTGAREVLEVLSLLRPRKIIYVSCEPPTLIRDLIRLETLGYSLKRALPLDMFPQTYHIEVIAELTAAGSPSSA